MLNKKDEKIFIELDDEITFVVERIKDTDADRITLVAPEGAGVISSLISLKLLSKLVYKLGKSLVLVTMDEAGQKFCKKANISVVRRVAEVLEEHWLASEARLKKRGMYPVLGRKGVSDSDSKEKSDSDNADGILAPTTPVSLRSTTTSLCPSDISPPLEGSLLRQEGKTSDDTDSETATDTDADTDTETVPDTVTDTDSPSLEDFGFTVDQDVAKQPAFLEKSSPTPPVVFEEDKAIDSSVESKQEFIGDFKQEPRGGSSPESKDDLKIVGKDMTGYRLEESVIQKFNPAILIGSLKKIKIPKIGLKGALPIAGFFVILGIIGGVYAYFIAPTAAIELKVRFDTVELEQEVRATRSVSDVDLENSKIPLILQEVEESGSDSAQATKTEIRGEKAKGKITLANDTQTVLQLDAGTAITGAGYDFVLLSNEEIPAGDFITRGSKEVDVEAYDIGEEYNLDSGVTFSVEGYSPSTALRGQNSESFIGGSKKEVLVVSAEDRDGLKVSLEDRLKERVKKKVKDQVGEGFVFNDSMIDLEVVSETFDAEVGAERDSFNLDMTVKAKAYIYAAEDLKTLGKQLLQGEVSSGLKLMEDDSEFVGDFLRRDGEDAVLNLKVTGVISGDVTEESVKDLIAGKKSDEVDGMLSSLEGVVEYSIVYGPEWLPSSFQHVPAIKGKVLVDLKLEKGEDVVEAEE